MAHGQSPEIQIQGMWYSIDRKLHADDKKIIIFRAPNSENFIKIEVGTFRIKICNHLPISQILTQV
jgi:hypothetical protein